MTYIIGLKEVELLEILIQFVLPIITATISYLAATKQSRNEVDKVQIQADNEIKKLEKEMEKQVEIYSQNAQMDIAKEMFSTFQNSPEGKRTTNKMMMETFLSNKK